MDVLPLFVSIGLVKTTTKSKTSNNMRKAYSYSRISVQSDNDQNLSLMAQKAKARAFCELNGLELLGEFSEVYSAKIPSPLLLLSARRPRLSKSIRLPRELLFVSCFRLSSVDT